MAWATSDRRSRLPINWNELRQAVKARAAGQCQHVDGAARCPAVGTDCDHIRNNDDHTLSNLQWLCHPHHQQKTQLESRRQFTGRRRPAPRPPGIA